MRDMISVVTPTLNRPAELAELLTDLCRQTLLPDEVIVVDGAPPEERATQAAVAALVERLPYRCRYIRHARGTAVQRNAGIDAAAAPFIAFVDDDVRLEPDFFQAVIDAFAQDAAGAVGGVVGYRTNQHFEGPQAARWRWYRRLGLLKVFEPGRYDWLCGYPINANMQPPFAGVREVDFMTTACAVWRREVFDAGLRFDPFFCDYGMLEDAHLSLRAGRRWRLWQCGAARCRELHAPGGRVDRRRVGFKCVVNYYYVFQDVARPLTWRHKARFWRFQAFELFRLVASAARRRRGADVQEVCGRLQGAWALLHAHDASVPGTPEFGNMPARATSRWARRDD